MFRLYRKKAIWDMGWAICDGRYAMGDMRWAICTCCLYWFWRSGRGAVPLDFPVQGTFKSSGWRWSGRRHWIMNENITQELPVERQPRRFEPVVHGGEQGYFESGSDVHLYDLMGDLPSSLDEPLDLPLDDQLVTTAAWAVPTPEIPKVEAWLKKLKQQPRGWLTPWREGEAVMPGDLWLDRGSPDPAVGTGYETYLVARLDYDYPPGLSLRLAMEAAVSRFLDLRRAIETSMRDALGATLKRATRPWLEQMEPLEAMDATEDELRSLRREAERLEGRG